MGWSHVRAVAGYAVAWLALAVALTVSFFLNSSAAVTVASHDAVVRPTLGGYATVHTGPFLPDVRRSTGSEIGVEIALGKTEASSTEELVARYAFIASQPDAQLQQVKNAVEDLLFDAALRGGVTALLPLVLWAMVGRPRRRELARQPLRHKVVTAAVTAGVVLVGVLVWEPWEDHSPMLTDDTNWVPLQEFIPEIDIPEEAAGLQISGNLTTSATKRLALSAVDTYARSRQFYADAREAAEDIEGLREPADDETVAVLVSDRHDNIGMDPVVREVADMAGATAVLDAGDDTSTGQEWEAFSLDSLNEAFGDYDERFQAAGNHDHGDFVSSYLEELGWTTAADEPVDGPGDSVLLAADDPRSSGLGTWRDEGPLTIAEVSQRIADTACESEERVNTLLVHDSDMGTEALERGCVDLVLSGHLHVTVGPTRVEGEDGVGYAFTNGTTGGAAYAVAVGSKLRRQAEFTMVTYRDGRPVGVQTVTLQTNGVFVVGDYIGLELEELEEDVLVPLPPVPGGPPSTAPTPELSPEP